MNRNAARMRAYRERHRGVRCRRCSRKPVLAGIRSCAWCLALDLEKSHRGMRHDTAAHAYALAVARMPSTTCEASGYTSADLAAAGLSLQVDRINPRRGYVLGNMQFLTSYLNRMKGRERSFPEWCLDELRERMERAHNPEARIMASFRTSAGSW